MSRSRVLVTREIAEPLAGWIRSGGGIPVHVPMFHLRATHAPPPERRPGLALVTSASSLRFVPSLKRHLQGAAVMAVGPQTALALHRDGIEPIWEGGRGGVHAVLALSKAWLRLGRPHVWYVGAQCPSASLSEALNQQSFSVDYWRVYENEPLEEAQEQLLAALPVDVITFASGSAVRQFAKISTTGQSRVVVIGQRTAAVAEEAGIPVHGIARTPVLKSLAEAALRG